MGKRKYRTREEWHADLRQVCASKNWEIVGNLPDAAKQKLTLRCKNHEKGVDAPEGYYEWHPVPGDIFQGKGCRLCSGVAPLTNAQVAFSASQVGLTLFPQSQRVTNNRASLQFQCNECSDVRRYIVCNVRNGQGCKPCADKRNGLSRRIPRATIVARLAVHRLKFVSVAHPDGDDAHVTYTCRFGHIHTQVLHTLKKSKGCAICSVLPRRETVLRQILEYLTGFKWPKQRVAWLLSPKRRKLELDGYCKEVGCAFEHQGEQHYKFVALWSKCQNYDQLKVAGCRAEGVKLLVTDEKGYDKAEKMGGTAGLVRWVARLLADLNVPMRPNPGQFRLEFNSTTAEARTRECHEFAKANDGKFLDPVCIAALAMNRWLCATHGKFERSLTDMKTNKSWCPKCGRELSGEARRKPFVTLSGFRKECRRIGVRSRDTYTQAKKSGAFQVLAPVDVIDYYKLPLSKLFQKSSMHGDPWQYTDEHDDPADLKDHPNAKIRRLSSGRLRRAVALPKKQPKVPANDNVDALADRLNAIYSGREIPD